MKKVASFFILILLGCSIPGEPGNYTGHVIKVRHILEKNSTEEALKLIDTYIKDHEQGMKAAAEGCAELKGKEVAQVFKPVMAEVDKLAELVKEPPLVYPQEVIDEFATIIDQYSETIEEQKASMQSTSAFFVNRAMAEVLLMRELALQFVKAYPLTNYALNTKEAILNFSQIMNMDDQMGIKR